MNDPTAPPLVIRFGAMGDMVLLTVLLDMLAERYGRPCDLLTSGAWSRALLEGQPSVSTITVIGSRTRPYWSDPQQWALVRALRARSPGAVYVVDTTKQDRLQAWLRRAGIADRHVLLRQRDPNETTRPWIERLQRFGQLAPQAHAAVPPASALPAHPRLVVGDAARADLAGFLAARSIEGPLWLLQPGSKRTLKRGRLAALDDDKWWPVERWSGLANALLANGRAAHVLLCGAPPEQPLLQSIVTATGDGRVHALGDALPLPRLLALCRIAVGMTSVDTGPAHAAVALGCPSVVLYGRASRSAWLPRGPAGTTVVPIGGEEDGLSRVADIALDQVLEASLALPPRAPPNAT
ncbi:glycosyltransferase family 9 protein [Pseudomarimonas salicorniae]|uniref:Glycosyltransferase family 9 protein n=1 Tax=Pseudomarimonas salicorniae TaxID=2933270 RepID=A0ABT0GE53_9GAMM|nr:glycosyltransferase family 9 protein [Lysobacter sp. CAU 1642]MCK7592823.1 glycosyltransferase family 9 protein [Lysobacter sp. CAU 1642]